MGVDENVGSLTPRGVFKFIASMLAPTDTDAGTEAGQAAAAAVQFTQPNSQVARISRPKAIRYQANAA